MLSRFVTIAIAATGLVACMSSAERAEKWNARWLGVHVDELITRKGPPTREYTLSDGQRIIEFRETREETVWRSTPGTVSRGPSTYETEGTIERRSGSSGSYDVRSTTRERQGTGFVTAAPSLRPAGTVQRVCIFRFRVGTDDRIKHALVDGDC
jgi:hypothetical protein